MNGTMHVVEKVDPKVHVAKRADAGSTAPTRKFVKNWKLADLEGAVAKGWESGRDTKRGHQLYTEAGCAKCHVVVGKGTAKVGPDLTGIVKKYQGKELLRHILNPSDALLEGYETFYLEIKDGEDVFGRVMKDDGESLHVVTNFDKPDELTVIAKSRIAEQLKSTMSTMPTGLLVTFSKEEILDLLAFLSSTK
jgi:putative heme-binding domain-containing protein